MIKSKLILGTVQFGLHYGVNNSLGKIPINEINDILNFSHDNGIYTLDTAAAYGDAELILGEQIKNIQPKKFNIITKFNLKEYPSPKDSFHQSLIKLKQESVETIMFHNYNDFISTKNSELNEILNLKGNKFKKLGISLYTNEEVASICRLNIFDLVQLPFNVLDNSNLRQEYFEMLKAKNIEIHTRSVFLQGLIFMEKNTIPINLKPLIPYLTQLDKIASDFSIKKEALILQYALTNPLISGVLIGVDSLNQLKSNLFISEQIIPKEAIEEINKINVKETSLLNPSLWKN